MSDNNPKGGNGGSTPTPFVFTPYTPSDAGIRPLPAAIPAWLCPAIHVNGVPYTGVPLTQGVQFNFSVVVKNNGALGALVTTRLYWGDPTTVFTSTTLTPIGQALVYVAAAGDEQESGLMPYTFLDAPQKPIPSHLCLLAEVTVTPNDPSSGTFDVANDRHYGQQNINVLLVQKGQRKAFPFRAANGGTKTAEFRIRVRSLAPEGLRYLETFYRAEAVSLKPKQITVGLVEAGRRNRPQQELRVGLEPGEARLCQITIDVPSTLSAGQFFAVEVEQTPAKRTEAAKQPPAATLGIVGFLQEDGS